MWLIFTEIKFLIASSLPLETNKPRAFNPRFLFLCVPGPVKVVLNS